MLDPLFTCEWVNFGLVIPLPVRAVGLRFILKLFFSWMWVRIEHVGPLAHFTMSWVLAWLYPCRSRQWGWVSFWILFFLTNVVEDLACWSPCSLEREWVLAWLYPCRYRQWGWESLWIFFSHECGWGSNILVPFVTWQWLSFGLIILLPVPAVGVGFILNFILFSRLWLTIQHAGPLARLVHLAYFLFISVSVVS
jgi:hypothetical protein